MTLTRPLASIFPGARSAVIRVLAGPDVAFTGRQVQQLASPPASLKAVQTALHALVAEGLILRDEVGRAHQYRFNHHHVAAPGILAILDGREEAFTRIRDLADSWKLKPAAIWLFGSVARFEETPESDLDLLVIRPVDVDEHSPEWCEQTFHLAERVQTWTGLICHILEYSSTDIDSGWHRQEPVLQDVWREGRTIWGPSVDGWFQRLREAGIDVAAREGAPRQG